MAGIPPDVDVTSIALKLRDVIRCPVLTTFV